MSSNNSKNIRLYGGVHININGGLYSIKNLINKLVYIKLKDNIESFHDTEICGFIRNIEIYGDHNQYFSMTIHCKLPTQAQFTIYNDQIIEILF